MELRLSDIIIEGPGGRQLRRCRAHKMAVSSPSKLLNPVGRRMSMGIGGAGDVDVGMMMRLMVHLLEILQKEQSVAIQALKESGEGFGNGRGK